MQFSQVLQLLEGREIPHQALVIYGEDGEVERVAAGAEGDPFNEDEIASFVLAAIFCRRSCLAAALELSVVPQAELALQLADYDAKGGGQLALCKLVPYVIFILGDGPRILLEAVNFGQQPLKAREGNRGVRFLL